MKKTFIALFALALTLAAALPALAQDPTPSATTGLSSTSGAAAAPQVQKPEAKNLRKEIVRLKYVRAQDIQTLLYAYVSRDGHISFNPNMPAVLSVSDTPSRSMMVRISLPRMIDTSCRSQWSLAFRCGRTDIHWCCHNHRHLVDR